MATPSTPTLQAALRDAGGNITHAAKALGMRRTTLAEHFRRHPDVWPEGVPHRVAGESVVNPAAADEPGVTPAPTQDLATQDVFITMQREVDKLLWKVEASMVQHRG